ncbi:hypothetical protein IWQ62_005815 [Dispira parvispora]|uniref:Thioredoxin-like fold domain-containing protein n=1 Tax=Dispira parvispora TaxID=1520584 RepID=A0A9W8AJ90_9FUNG|nr:hypothetical protein IWQ62_005815 [Dispira parvispora]
MALVTTTNVGHRLGPSSAPTVIEAYLDYACPFSKLFYRRFVEDVFPYIQKTYSDQVQFIFRHQVQGWHPQSTLLAEAALAVESVDPQAFYPFSTALFAHQQDYFDEAIYNRSWHDLHQSLANLASQVGVDPARVQTLLAIKHSPEPKNLGNQVTGQLKSHIKLGRQQGIHVSPTVLFNGIVDNSISSSWTLDQWVEYLQTKLSKS